MASSSSASASSSPVMSELGLFLKTCATAYAAAYLFLCFLMGLPAVMMHLFVLGIMLCAVSFFRLPAPSPESALSVLGADPRNLDGSPSKKSSCCPTMAHRAAGLDAPENSLEAVRAAKKNGARVIEFDVALTADGHAVVFHDDTLARLTGKPDRIDQLTLEEVRKVDIAERHVLRDEFTPTRIPTLADFVAECLKHDLRMVIDLKTYLAPEATAKIILELFQRHADLHSKAMVSSFWPHLIYLVRSRDPRIICSMAWRPQFLAYESYSAVAGGAKRRFDGLLQHYAAVAGDVVLRWGLHEFLWYFLGLSAVLVEKDYLTLGYVQMWRERGVRVIAWTVNNSVQKMFLRNYLGVAIMSDTMDQIPESVLLEDSNRSDGGSNESKA